MGEWLGVCNVTGVAVGGEEEREEQKCVRSRSRANCVWGSGGRVAAQ